MKRLLYLTLLSGLLGCQTESLDIRAPYRIRLNAASPGTTFKVRQAVPLQLELLTDSYYAQYGYQLQFYQQTGLGRLSRSTETESQPVLQNVGINLPLGASTWQYTPEAVGYSQIVLIAQQERGYTLPDTVRLNFQIVP